VWLNAGVKKWIEMRDMMDRWEEWKRLKEKKQNGLLGRQQHPTPCSHGCLLLLSLFSLSYLNTITMLTVFIII